MKYLMLLVLTILLTWSCSKKTDEEIKILMKESDSVGEVSDDTESISIDIPESAEKEEKERPEGTFKIDYETTWGDIYSVMFSLFKNQHHPNGYVIISVVEIDKSEEVTETYTISKSKDPKDYIEYIHQHEVFGAEKEYESVSLANSEEFKGYFRTAEAMVVAYLTEGIVDADTVAEAGVRMRDRRVGIMLRE